ncbi:putative alpha-1,3-glucanase/mutanase [Mycena vulgaris]|nr:putative alpha-1,3-glucanase/mutanase [Mycena vulgaris]
MRSSAFRLLLAATSALVAHALPQPNGTQLVERQANSKLVFCHFMIDITSDRGSAAGYDDDMRRAKVLGIDAFALNIGTDPYTNQQLGFAYESANNNGMKVFVSFDFNWYNTGQGSAVGAKIAQFAGLPAQLFVTARHFRHRSPEMVPVYFAPNFHPGQGDFGAIDGALNWFGWPNNGNNKAPSGGLTVTVNSEDQSYLATLGGKGCIALASRWFSTHFGPEVFPGDLLWYMRWVKIRELLSNLALKSTFVEIVAYGESHYIGPLSSPHTDDGGSKSVNDMPHGGWLDMAKLPSIHSPPATRSSTGTAARPKPSTATRPTRDRQRLRRYRVIINLSRNSRRQLGRGGVHVLCNFHVGSQSFMPNRNGAQVMTATSLELIQNVCPCGLYNSTRMWEPFPPTRLTRCSPMGWRRSRMG